MKLKPLADNVIVKPIAKEDITKSGIVLPDTGSEKPEEGEVVAVGTGKVLENGSRQQMEIKVGQKVFFRKYAPTEVKVDGEKYFVLSESDIFAVVE
ncbi:MAG: co-chaperone GroES [bacterium]